MKRTEPLNAHRIEVWIDGKLRWASETAEGNQQQHIRLIADGKVLYE